MERLNRLDHRWSHPLVPEVPFWSVPGVNVAYDALGGKGTEELDWAQEEAFGASSLDVLDASDDQEWHEWRRKGTFQTYHTEHGCPEEIDAPPVKIIVRAPVDIDGDERLPLILSLPGSGLCVAGTAENAMSFPYRLMERGDIRCIEANVTYRLAPQHPCPAAINDCHAAYQFVVEHADELHVDPEAIVLYGNSSGGHMCLSLAFRLARYGYHGHMPRGIVLITPVLDDAADTNSGRISFEGEDGNSNGWDARMNELTFGMWLGDRFGDPTLPPEYVPNRAKPEDFESYPPVWFACVDEMEPSRDSAYRFAQMLHGRGIFCTFHEWGGTTHMSSLMDPNLNEYADLIWKVMVGSLRDALFNDLRRQWLFEK